MNPNPFPRSRCFPAAFSTVLLVCTGLALASPESQSKKIDSVTVQAFADRSAVAPGEILNIAVSLKIDEGWHVYWQSPGPGTGLPTQLKWKLPAGFQVGRTQFPVPEAKYSKELEETAFVLEGAPVLLTPIRVSQSAKPGEEITFTVEASWLACKTKCIPGSAEVSLKLPVVAKGTKPPSANDKLFQKARSALPMPTEKAEHLKLSGAITPTTLKPGDKATAVLTVDIAVKHHMQSHKPHQEELIAAYVFTEQTPGLEIGDVEYPPAHDRTDKTLGKLSEYTGKIELKIPITVEDDADKSPRWLRGVFQYQICTDAGTCYPPQHVEWSIPVRMEGGQAPENPDSWTASSLGPVAIKDATPDAPADGVLARIEKAFLSFGFPGIAVLAMIGGFILNFMPCVLPVISLKILSYVRQAKEDRARIFLLGLSYCLGILVFFSLLGYLYYQTGEGWGQHFQSPHVILVLAAVVTAFALSLFGVFAVFTPKVFNELGQKAEGEGPLSAFATGVLATVLGTACTAPFLSAAVGAASKFPPAQGASIFIFVGIGMALPFLLLSAQPGWLRFVPRPGPWMGTFETLMGFLLLGTAIWLLNPIRDQIGDYGLLLALIFLLFVALAVWIKGRIAFGAPAGRKAALWTVMLAVLAVGWLLPFRLMSSIDHLRDEVRDKRKLINAGRRSILLGVSDQAGPLTWKPDWNKGITWLAFDETLIRRFVEGGYTVFVDYTASWCVNCKTNLRTSIDTEATRRLFKELNVVTFEADYTNKDEEIAASLKKHNKAGVPLYLVYQPRDFQNPRILPEILTPGIVADALNRAGPSKP